MLLPLDASGCGGLDSVSGVECRAITPFRACSKVESQSTIHNFQLFISEVWLAALTEAARSKRETDQQLLSYLLLVRSCVGHPLVPHALNRLKISLVSQQKGLLASFPRESPQEKPSVPAKRSLSLVPTDVASGASMIERDMVEDSWKCGGRHNSSGTADSYCFNFWATKMEIFSARCCTL